MDNKPAAIQSLIWLPTETPITADAVKQTELTALEAMRYKMVDDLYVLLQVSTELNQTNPVQKQQVYTYYKQLSVFCTNIERRTDAIKENKSYKPTDAAKVLQNLQIEFNDRIAEIQKQPEWTSLPGPVKADIGQIFKSLSDEFATTTSTVTQAVEEYKQANPSWIDRARSWVVRQFGSAADETTAPTTPTAVDIVKQTELTALKTSSEKIAQAIKIADDIMATKEPGQTADEYEAKVDLFRAYKEILEQENKIIAARQGTIKNSKTYKLGKAGDALNNIQSTLEALSETAQKDPDWKKLPAEVQNQFLAIHQELSDGIKQSTSSVAKAVEEYKQANPGWIDRAKSWVVRQFGSAADETTAPTTPTEQNPSLASRVLSRVKTVFSRESTEPKQSPREKEIAVLQKIATETAALPEIACLNNARKLLDDRLTTLATKTDESYSKEDAKDAKQTLQTIQNGLKSAIKTASDDASRQAAQTYLDVVKSAQKPPKKARAQAKQETPREEAKKSPRAQEIEVLEKIQAATKDLNAPELNFARDLLDNRLKTLATKTDESYSKEDANEAKKTLNSAQESLKKAIETTPNDATRQAAQAYLDAIKSSQAPTKGEQVLAAFKAVKETVCTRQFVEEAGIHAVTGFAFKTGLAIAIPHVAAPLALTAATITTSNVLARTAVGIILQKKSLREAFSEAATRKNIAMAAGFGALGGLISHELFDGTSLVRSVAHNLGHSVSTQAHNVADSVSAQAHNVADSVRAHLLPQSPPAQILVPAPQGTLPLDTATPTAPVAHAPVAPVAQAPVAPVAQAPVAPVAQAPVAPVAQAPVAPVVDAGFTEHDRHELLRILKGASVSEQTAEWTSRAAHTQNIQVLLRAAQEVAADQSGWTKLPVAADTERSGQILKWIHEIGLKNPSLMATVDNPNLSQTGFVQGESAYRNIIKSPQWAAKFGLAPK